MRTLVVEIALPDYFIAEDETAEDVEAAMQMVNSAVAVVFAATDGDDPRVVLHSLEGSVTEIRVRDDSNQERKP